jgi:4-amino-4-deoxy-L-arabinose transferase-like glycosyltransferase
MTSNRTRGKEVRVAQRIPRVANGKLHVTESSALLVGLALVDFVAHMLVSGNYGYFRDELYYIEAGRHLAFGYVDFPPLIALVAKFLGVLAGDALWAIHIGPALATALIVLLTGLMARELGGGRFAQALAAVASLVAVTFLATGSLFSMDALDELWWVLASYVLILILKRNDARLWPLFGLIAGVGLTTKVTILFFGVAVVVGLLLTPARRHFRAKWIWLGSAISFAFLLPYLLWNMAYGWPTLEFFGNYEGSGGPLEFLLGQIPGMNPLTLPLSFAGLIFYLRIQGGKPYRALGWTFVVLLFVLALLGAKPYFLAPAYPMLFAGGAVLVEHLGGRARGLIKAVYVVLLLVSGLLLAPLAMPILPPATFSATYGFLSGTGNAAAGQDAQGIFPQPLGDRFGWENMARTVADTYDGLPTEERARTCIFTSNYGEASALNFLGGRYRLPPAISGHNSYYLWGPGSCTAEIIVTVGIPRGKIQQVYAGIERAATITCRYCVPEENDVPVYVATKPIVSIQKLWPQTKHYE